MRGYKQVIGNYCTDMKTISKLSLFLLILTVSCRQSSSKPDRNLVLKTDSLKEFQTEKNNWENKILEANAKYKIGDSTAFHALGKIQEIREILDYKYKDSTIRNNLVITDFPTDSVPSWKIDLVQDQSRLEKYSTILFTTIDANTGQIKITDMFLEPDKELILEDWLKLKRKKK